MPRPIDAYLLSAWPRLMGYALKLTREPDSARDLVHHSAVRALSAQDAPREEKAALAWLFKIVRHAWIDQTRRRAVRARDAVEIETDDTWTFENRLISALSVRQALNRLTSSERRLIDLVDVQGLSYREAASALNLPVGTVMSRLHRARARLLALIEAAAPGAASGNRP